MPIYEADAPRLRKEHIRARLRSGGELARNGDSRTGGYQPERAHRLAWERQRRPKGSKLSGCRALRGSTSVRTRARPSPRHPAPFRPDSDRRDRSNKLELATAARERLTGEILGACQDSFRSISARRKWSSTPVAPVVKPEREEHAEPSRMVLGVR
jgi:hypothetical protein